MSAVTQRTRIEAHASNDPEVHLARLIKATARGNARRARKILLKTFREDED